MMESLDQNWIGNEEEEIYKENILDHYKNPHNFGTLNDYNFKHKENNPVCGDVIEIFVKLNNDKVEDVKFSGSGCAISIASTSMLTDYIKGKTLDEIKRITKEDILNLLGINLGVVRIKCGLLSLNTLLKGIKESEDKNEASN